MARNSGKGSEHIFESVLRSFGKRAYFCRLVDAAEVYGRVGKTGNLRPQPSDYIIVIDGQTSFAEVKSTHDNNAFRFSLLRTKQSAAAEQIVKAGGSYFIFLHRVPTNEWYCIPYERIMEVKSAGKASISWSDLREDTWKISSSI